MAKNLRKLRKWRPDATFRRQKTRKPFKKLRNLRKPIFSFKALRAKSPKKIRQLERWRIRGRATSKAQVLFRSMLTRGKRDRQ